MFLLFSNALFGVASFGILNILHKTLNIKTVIFKQICYYVLLFHDMLLCEYTLAKKSIKQSSHCFFDIWFKSKNGLQFLMKCVPKMENVFVCGRLMAYFKIFTMHYNFCSEHWHIYVLRLHEKFQDLALWTHKIYIIF